MLDERPVILARLGILNRARYSIFIRSNAEAQLPPEQPKAAEGTRSAPALWAVNCSVSLCIFTICSTNCHLLNFPGTTVFAPRK
jgi:hypothetical protein